MPISSDTVQCLFTLTQYNSYLTRQLICSPRPPLFKHRWWHVWGIFKSTVVSCTPCWKAVQSVLWLVDSHTPHLSWPFNQLLYGSMSLALFPSRNSHFLSSLVQLLIFLGCLLFLAWRRQVRHMSAQVTRSTYWQTLTWVWGRRQALWLYFIDNVILCSVPPNY